MNRSLCCLALSALIIVGAPPVYAQLAESSIAKLWRPGDAGTRLELRGRVLGEAGRALEGAEIHLRQADGTGSYHSDRYRAQLRSGKRGAFAIQSVLPGQYYGAKHIHVVVRHQAYAPLHTRILFRGDPNIDAAEDDLAIALEEVKRDEETVLVGNVELLMRSAPSN